MQSMLEYMGRVPYSIAGYIKNSMQYKNTLMGIIEGLGNVYGLENASKLNGIDTYAFSWKVDVSQIPTPRFTQNCTASGANAQEFTIFVNANYYATTDVLRLEGIGQQLFILTDAKPESNGEYSHVVRLVTNDPNEALDTRYTTLNRTTMLAYNAQPEWSVKGTTKFTDNFETHFNTMTKIRIDQAYSSDFKATEERYFISDDDLKKSERFSGGSFKIFQFPKIEQLVLDTFIQRTNGFMLWGRSTMNPTTGRSYLQLQDGQDIPIGSGLIQQVEDFAYTIDYTQGNMSVRHMQMALNHIIERRGKSVDNHITCLCTRKFYNDVAAVLKSELFATNPYGMWFYTKDAVQPTDSVTGKPSNKLKYYGKLPNELSVGATFNTYIYQGNTINFIVEEELTKYKQGRGYAIFMDTGLFVDENDKPAPVLSMFTLKGRENIKFTSAGIGGLTGTTSGAVSSLVDGSTIGMLGWRGLAYRIPYATVIFQEQA